MPDGRTVRRPGAAWIESAAAAADAEVVEEKCDVESVTAEVPASIELRGRLLVTAEASNCIALRGRLLPKASRS